MAKVSRLSDTNQEGGRILRGAKTVYVNGIAIGLHVSRISGHGEDEHDENAAYTTEGSPTVFAEGVPVLRVGSGNSCGHRIAKGSEDVFVP
jgi:uncharacterized Zn-binding protein involved in type VI secretion